MTADVETPWARPAAPTLGVLGPRALTERLARCLPIHRFVPTDANVADVDAVVVARSAVEVGGPWAGALRPAWFDRGVALRGVLRAAGDRGCPVLLLDDVPDGAAGGWHTMLDGAVDAAVVLGAFGADEGCWHPGIHWDATALRLAVTPPTGDNVPGPLGSAEWRRGQRRAAMARAIAINPRDPWQRHAAAEAASLGVAVRDAASGELVATSDGATPSAAVAALCARLGLAPPPRPALGLVHAQTSPSTLVEELAQLTGRPVHADGRAAAREPHAGPVLVAPPDDGWDPGAARACAAAIDRLGDEDAVAVRVRGTLAATAAATATLVPASPASAGTLHRQLAATAIDLEALA